MSSPRNRRSSRCRAGFTLAEILVAVLVMAIVAAMVVANGASADGSRLQAAAHRLTADLRYAQNMAVTHQKSVTVTVNPAENKYTLSDSEGALTHPTDKDAYEVTLNTGEFEDVVVSSAFADGHDVTFDETGTPGAGGSVVLSMNGSSYTVEVQDVTGMVRCSRD